ncbi:MAG: hypothetical protein IT308_11825 [Anaerolineaceae bacterium]|nr:hypothetical protein [Anaerolineaceae bacterium]
MMSKPVTAHQWEQLSSYLDGELTVEHKNRLDSELKSNPELTRALETLQRTRSLVRSLPQKPLQRNFTLTPSMVAPKSRAPFILFPFFSAVSAVAAIFFFITLFFTSPAVSQTRAALQSPAQEEALSAPPESGEQEKPAPLIFFWGIEGRGGGGGQFSAEMAKAPETVPDIPLPPLETTPQPKIAATQPPPQAPLEGSGPILGIQETTPLPAPAALSAKDENTISSETQLAGRGSLPIALAGAAIASALAAYFFWKKSRT